MVNELSRQVEALRAVTIQVQAESRRLDAELEEFDSELDTTSSMLRRARKRLEQLINSGVGGWYLCHATTFAFIMFLLIWKFLM